MVSPAAKGSAAEAAAGAAVAAAVAAVAAVAAATLPLVFEEVASAPAPSDMAQRMMCVSWLCVDAALFNRVFSVYCGIVVPYSAAPMCQLAHALRFGHVGACLPTIWYVPVHLLPYRRGIDPSERSQGCLLSAVALPGKAV